MYGANGKLTVQEELKKITPNVMPPGSDLMMVISQVIPPDKSEAFLEWQHLMTDASSKFAGYERTEVFPPADGLHEEWITIVRFDSKENLDAWVGSVERASLNDEFKEKFGDFHMRRIGSGFDLWMQPAAQTKIPPWKMALTVLVALYPTLLLLQALITFPLLGALHIPHPFKMLVSILFTISAMNWVVMPFTVKNLKWWHYPEGDPGAQQATTLKGVALIVSIILVTAFIFVPFFPKT